MYRVYKYMPEGNRHCVMLDRKRAYQQHLDALKRTRASLDMSTPEKPAAMGLDMKKHEIERQRALDIQKENYRLLGNIKKIENRKAVYKDHAERGHSLQGQWQKEQVYQINQENMKVVKAIHERKPVLNRNDFLWHECDHEYQYMRKSLYKPTLPMGKVIRNKLASKEKRAPRRHAAVDGSSTERSELFVTSQGGKRAVIPDEHSEEP